MAKYKVKWVVADKHLIKFHDVDDSYNVEESLDLSGIESNSQVEVDIKDNIVVKISLATDKKEEVKKEVVKEEKPVEKEPLKQEANTNKSDSLAEPSEKEIETHTWTIQGMTKKRDVVKFVEQSKSSYWYPIEDKVRQLFFQLNKGDKVTIEIGKVQVMSQKGDAYMKDGIVGVIVDKVEKAKEIVEEKESAPVVEKTQVKQSSYRNEDETTRRTILMCSKDILQSLIVADHVFKEEIPETLLFITEAVKNTMSNI